MMSTTKAKQVVRLADMSKELPTSEKMVKVESLLSVDDEKFVKDFSIGSICVQIDQEYFFLSKQHSVPDFSKLVRQDEGQHQGQLVGIPAIVGG